jgi:CRP-like cAMP-binding protein
VDLFRRLAPEQRSEIAAGTSTRLFGDGEAIVRQGAEGQSMFVVCSGRVSVVLEPDRRQVATIGAGDYFGEMSLLTGEPRTATVLAVGDTTVLELNADLFRSLGSADPRAVEQIGIAAATRRVELHQAREAGKPAPTEVHATLLTRMKQFLGLA